MESKTNFTIISFNLQYMRKSVGKVFVEKKYLNVIIIPTSSLL